MAKRQLNRRQNWRIERFKASAPPAPPSVNHGQWKHWKAVTSARNRPDW